MPKRKFTAKDYNKVQKLVDMDIKTSDICKITGWSNAVVYQTIDTNDYEEYLAVNEERMTQYRLRNEKKTVQLPEIDDELVVNELHNSDEVLKTLLSIESLLLEQTKMMREQRDLISKKEVVWS